jgi:hypothetical protein
MKPYYADDLVTLFHGDCREIAPDLAWDVLISDPPFGMAWRSGRQGVRGTSEVANDHDTAARDWIVTEAGGRPFALFGTWKVARPAGLRAVLVWDKGPHVGSGDLSFPWKPNWEEIYIAGPGWSGDRTTGVLSVNAPSPNFHGLRVHPTEKPVDLMQLLVRKSPPGVILDPFAGSGSTLVAAKNLGRTAIGVELEERYCEIIAARLNQSVLDLGGAA